MIKLLLKFLALYPFLIGEFHQLRSDNKIIVTHECVSYGVWMDRNPFFRKSINDDLPVVFGQILFELLPKRLCNFHILVMWCLVLYGNVRKNCTTKSSKTGLKF